MPGLVDAHTHAPQYVFAGTGMDVPLLDWLSKYTFPTEAKFHDTDFARSSYTRAVVRGDGGRRERESERERESVCVCVCDAQQFTSLTLSSSANACAKH